MTILSINKYIRRSDLPLSNHRLFNNHSDEGLRPLKASRNLAGSRDVPWAKAESTCRTSLRLGAIVGALQQMPGKRAAAGWLGRKREPGNVSFTPRRKHATDYDGQVLNIQSRVASFKFHQLGVPITQDNSNVCLFYFFLFFFFSVAPAATL